MTDQVIGVDEVGRGAWAGPLVFCAVILSQPIFGLKDSKKLSKSKRLVYKKLIEESAKFIGYGWVSSSEIDDLGLTKASTLACERALKKAPKDYKILLDGKVDYLSSKNSKWKVECVVGGDDIVPVISAASILAKVARDEFMAEQARIYPGYNLETNVGYGTKSHDQAITDNGLTPLHRWSFAPIKKRFNTYET